MYFPSSLNKSLHVNYYVNTPTEINILFSRKVENKITDPREIEIRPWTTGMINFARFVNARQVVPSICQVSLI